ncbi:FtsX-like permease family protein, partial [bacterium]|nr:FtsX-like permease family protein [bacterium]
QKILGLEKQINEIKALDCYCRIPGVDPLTMLREQVAEKFPDVMLFQIRPIAEARQRQRAMLDGYFSWIMPIVVIACGLWIGALAMLNTRDRREEIGVLRALGYGSGKIAALFLGKAILIGLVGSIIGYFIGTWMALQVGPTLFEATAKSIKPQIFILYWSLILAPAFAAISSFIPAMIAVSQDPADVLRQDL